MALTRELLEARLAELRAGLQRAQAEADHAQRVVIATDGAVQECEWAIAQLEAEPPTAPE